MTERRKNGDNAHIPNGRRASDLRASREVKILREMQGDLHAIYERLQSIDDHVQILQRNHGDTVHMNKVRDSRIENHETRIKELEQARSA